MKLYEITLNIRSGFGTEMKGDTLFGHFCWQVAHDDSLVQGGLEKQLRAYAERPFAIFSSAAPRLGDAPVRYALKRPEMPPSRLYSLGEEKAQRIKKAKEVKKEKWLSHSGYQTIALNKAAYYTDETLCQAVGGRTLPSQVVKASMASVNAVFKSAVQPHNTINRLTQSTGVGRFAPYAVENIHYHPRSRLALWVLLDTNATDINGIVTGLKRIGRWGYGRDASIGMGRFEVAEHKEIPFPELDRADACYTLSPSLPDMARFEQAWFKPFVRFGKHGDQLVHSGMPFKNPVIMVDEGAVLVPREKSLLNKPYLGRAITQGVSLTMPRTAAQGYTLYLPVIWSESNAIKK